MEMENVLKNIGCHEIEMLAGTERSMICDIVQNIRDFAIYNSNDKIEKHCLAILKRISNRQVQINEALITILFNELNHHNLIISDSDGGYLNTVDLNEVLEYHRNGAESIFLSIYNSKSILIGEIEIDFTALDRCCISKFSESLIPFIRNTIEKIFKQPHQEGI